MFEEQRQHRRFPMRTVGHLQTADGAAPVETTTVDLSGGGMSLRFSRQLRRDTEVTVAFALPTGARLELRGLVRHCTAVVAETEGPSHRGIYIVGVEFSSITAAEREAIEQACVPPGEPRGH